MKKLSKHLLAFVMVCCMVLGLSLSVGATSVSSDAGIKSMAVSPGALEPAFSTDVTEYTATVANDVDKILVGAEANDPSAKIVITGNAGLQVGENTVYINVTAADGQTSKRYTIIVTKQEEAAAETPAPETESAAETAAGEQPTIAADPNAQGSADAQNTSLLPGLHNEVPEVTNPGFVSAAKLQEIEANYQQQLELRLYVIIGLAALCLILLIALAVSIGKASKYAARAEEAEEALEAGAAAEENAYSEGAYPADESMQEEAERAVEIPAEYFDEPAPEIPLEAAVSAALAEAVSEITLEEELQEAEEAAEVSEAENETSEDDGLEDISEADDLEEIPETEASEETPEEIPTEAADTIFVAAEEIPETLDDLGNLFGEASENGAAEDEDIVFELPKMPEERVPVIYDRNAEKNVQAITVDEGNEELDDDFAMLESLLSDTNRQPEPFVMPEDSPAAKPVTLEDDDDFEILDL